MTGVDPASEMIAAARSKPGADKVRWVVGAVADLDHEDRFNAAVMTGHAFQCLLEDGQVVELFKSVARRLLEGGSFWFETRNPTAKPWQRWTPEHAKPPISLTDGRSLLVTHNVPSVEGEFVTFSETYTFNHGEHVHSSTSCIRFMSLTSIEAFADRAGLRVRAVVGNWNGELFGENSPEIIVELRNKQSRR